MTDTTSAHMCVCLCVLASVFAHICTSLISLGKCSPSLRPDLRWQMHLPGGTVGMCASVWKGAGCNCGNCKQSLVLSSSFFPLSLAVHFPRLLRASACVRPCLSPPVSNVQISCVATSHAQKAACDARRDFSLSVWITSGSRVSF